MNASTDFTTLSLIMEIQDREEQEAGRVAQDANNIPPASQLNLSPDLPLEATEQQQPILLDQKLDVVVITLLNDQDVEKTILALNSTLKKRKVTGVVYAVSDIINADAFKEALQNAQPKQEEQPQEQPEQEEAEDEVGIEQNPAEENPQGM